jgi:hypothetical protein
VIFDFITIFILGALLLLAFYTVLRFLGKFPGRTIDDVTPYLRPTDMATFEAILGPAEEVNYRLRLSPQEFRQVQRKRVHLLRECLLRMSHHAMVLIEWGNMEWTGPHTEQKRTLGHELVQSAVEFRLYSLLALIKLKVWIVLLPFVSITSLRGLRTVAGIDPVRAYNRVKLAAESLGLIYGLQFQQELVSRL